MQRIEWYSSTRNARSRAVAQRAGMRLDGVLRSYYLHNGIRHDKEVWSILADEWLASDLRPTR